MDLLVVFEDYELDEARFELRKAGQPLTIQPKLLELLLYLAREHQRVVPKQELFDRVWRGVHVSEGALNQAVSLVRKLLGDSPDAQRHIRTVRGRGLQFVARFEVSVRAITPPRVALADSSQSTVRLDDKEQAHGTDRLEPHLFVVLHAHSPMLGAARYALAHVDEVAVGRGDERKAQLVEASVTRRLMVALPDEAMSRAHLHLVRTREGWCAVDRGSKNGTTVDGRRTDSALLKDDDIIECGRTYLLFRIGLPTPHEGLRIDDRDGASASNAARTLLPAWPSDVLVSDPRLPPLRERKADVGVLFAALLRTWGRVNLRFSPDAARALLRHDWPGGVRELERLVQRLSAEAQHVVSSAELAHALAEE